MKEAVVVDSTCLIGLERINALFVLAELFTPIFISPEVEIEFGSTFADGTAQNIKNQVLVQALNLLVDAGEAEALALAQEQQCLLITDDKQARSVAKKLGIRFLGTIGVLIRAKEAKIIPNIKIYLDELIAQGFFISERLRAEALAICGE